MPIVATLMKRHNRMIMIIFLVTTTLFGHRIEPNTKDDSYITYYGMLCSTITDFKLSSLGRNNTNYTNSNLAMVLGSKE